MNLRIWIPCILLIVVIIIAVKTSITEGFQVGPTTPYVPPVSLSVDETRINFWAILSKDKAGLPITRGSSSESGSESGSGSGSSPINLLDLVINPGPKDIFTSVYPKYLSMYALAKYNYNPTVARSALINQYDQLQNELQTAVETEQATRTLFANNPANASCNQLNTITMAFYGKLVSLYSSTQDLSGAERIAESLHDENLGLQDTVSSACSNQGPIPSPECIKLATRDETIFPLIPSFDALNVKLLTSGQDIQDIIDVLVQAYKGIGCSFPSAGSGSSGSSGSAAMSIDTVFSSEYLESLQIIDTYSLNSKLQELSPYYVSPAIINYISGKLIGTSDFNAGLSDSLDYLADMNKITNSIVSLHTDMMPVKAGEFYSEGGETAGGFANCPPGYYCPLTATMPILCPVGTYCPAGTTDAPIDCPREPVQLFSPAGATSEAQCTTDWPAGYYVDPKTKKLVQCPTGSYCINGVRTQCPPGTINRKKGQSTEDSCLFCPTGSYCNSSVLSKPCPLGTYNPLTKQSTLAACRKCPPGTYCSQMGTTVPSPCPAGQFSNVEGLKMKACTNVQAGYYLTGTGHATDAEKIPCTVAHYCPAGCATPVLCPAGNYCDTTGLPTPKPCPGGTYGSTSGLSTSACTGKCTAGYVCPPGSTMPTVMPCPAGTFCPTGSAEAKPCPAGYYCGPLSAAGTPCERGTYNPDVGQVSVEACRICPPEKFCGLGTAIPGPCPLGNYCPGGRDIYGSVEGTYCDETGLRAPKPCPPGTYNPGINSISVTDCKPCDGGTYDTAPGQMSCRNTSPKGSYCASPKTMIAYAVPETGKSVYPNATNGTIVLPIGSTEPAPCPPGTYCNASGMGVPTPCPPGTYSMTTGGDSENVCIPCVPGKYCPAAGGSTQQSCPVGTYCPIQGGSSPTQCPIASVCPIPELQTPLPCPPGDLCNTRGLGSAPYLQCPAGTYSTGSAGSSCTPCPNGTYGLGNSKTSACSGLCAAGYYCGPGTTTATPPNKLCPMGYYCPPATGTLCPAGKTFTNERCS